ncbi:hypothetical protein [Actinokineospora terrae]|uniref:MalT-like TPR region domain-containing protein n=1 Tax=Actinokineospora terrae TaxID=155974 RepID=A0A1H9MC02_9PSEU|nr:hypothetical protein [Actinokineospora terrae]SER20683.1 hypothetical protein SAMN04487818_10255 [Actinokineospora terrae]
MTDTRLPTGEPPAHAVPADDLLIDDLIRAEWVLAPTAVRVHPRYARLRGEAPRRFATHRGACAWVRAHRDELGCAVERWARAGDAERLLVVAEAGTALLHLGDTGLCRRVHDLAVPLLPDDEDGRQRAMVLGRRLTHALIEFGEPGSALVVCADTLRRARALREDTTQVEALTHSAAAHLDLGDPAAARADLGEALSAQDRDEASPARGRTGGAHHKNRAARRTRVLCLMAQACARGGDLDDAVTWLDAATAIAAVGKRQPRTLFPVHVSTAIVRLARGEPDIAAAAAGAAITVLRARDCADIHTDPQHHHAHTVAADIHTALARQADPGGHHARLAERHRCAAATGTPYLPAPAAAEPVVPA